MTDLLIDHIVSDPEIRGGRPRIRGTGITVQNIVEDMAAGLKLNNIVEQFELSLGQIYAALSYYHDHQSEIDHAIQGDQVALQTLMASDDYKTSQDHSRQIKAKLAALKPKID